MSGFSSQGVGAACSANAVVVRTASAAATQKLLQKLLVENRVILHAPSNRSREVDGPSVSEQITNSIVTSTSWIARPTRGVLRLCDFPLQTSRLSSLPIQARTACSRKRDRDDSDEPSCEDLFWRRADDDACACCRGGRVQAQQ